MNKTVPKFRLAFVVAARFPVGGAGCTATGGGATGQSTPLPPIRVEGAHLVAGGREVRLRGVNWGWWHDAGTVYTEREAERMARWGANLMRLPFSYKDVESDARDGTLEESAEDGSDMPINEPLLNALRDGFAADGGAGRKAAGLGSGKEDIPFLPHIP